MLSAVENYGSAAAATHAYAHHHNFSIAAAAAAAAGTAAAAAAAVIPSQQAVLDHHHHHMLAAHSTLNQAGLLLPSTQLPNALPSPEAVASMSSAEFLRPHPKQPRYNGSTNNNSGNSISNPATSPNSAGNTNGSSNGIPLHVRSSKIGNSSLNLSNSPPSRSKYPSEQSAPVNLATSNNNSAGMGSSVPPQNKGSSMESLPPPPRSPSEREREIIAGMYAAQKLPFPQSEAAAAAVYQYSRVLANRPLYGDQFYVAHQLARSQLHARPPFLTDQFPTYLHPPPSAYSPPGAPNTLLGPPPAPPVVSSQLGSPHSTSSMLSNSHNNATSSSLSTTQLPALQERHSHTAASSSLHHSNSPHLPQSTLAAMDRQSGSYVKEKDLKSMNPLNGKHNVSNMLESQAGFKVPSGKEGSMKHRILTRPSYEKDAGRHRAPVSASVFRNSSNAGSPTNFTKGSLIELSTGELRRVEDMRTEDFVQSAERNQHLELADSTVVKISPNSHNVAITFSYNKNRSKVDIDASMEHPFFVYGQGWASCNPELTLKAFGLKCQRLQVGDVCISLKPRESSASSTNSYPSSSAQSPSSQSSPSYHFKDESVPQNLSRKALSTSSISQTSTVPTTATGTTVSSRLSVPISQHLPPPTSIMSSHIAAIQQYDMLHAYGANPPVSSQNSHHISSNAAAMAAQHLSHHQLQRQKIEGHVVLARGDHRSSSSPSSPASRPPSNHQPYYLGTSDKYNGREQHPSPMNGNLESNQMLSNDQETAIDASTSRKRRWSWSNAPGQGNDDRDVQSPKVSCNSNC